MIYFTSDLHINHDNLFHLYQGNRRAVWKTLDHMTEGIIENWNRRVTDKDEVYLLGDMVMGYDKPGTIKRVTARLNGKKHMVLGNHDLYKRPGTYLEAGFETVDHQHELFIDNYSIWLQHKPPVYSEGNPASAYGFYHYVLHGHLHGNYAKITGTANYKHWIDVGLDAQPGFEPKTFEELIQNISCATGECIKCERSMADCYGLCSQQCGSMIWTDEERHR